jgi:hypothetical protein
MKNSIFTLMLVMMFSCHKDDQQMSLFTIIMGEGTLPGLSDKTIIETDD